MVEGVAGGVGCGGGGRPGAAAARASRERERDKLCWGKIVSDGERERRK